MKSSMEEYIQFKPAISSEDLIGILDLQEQSLISNIPIEDRPQEGFLTLAHTFDVLSRMNQPAAHTIAVQGDKVVAYALSMDPAQRMEFPLLYRMFDVADQRYGTEARYIAMGQICVGKEFRGKGLFRKLYAAMKERLSDKYTACVTLISERNPRSLQAHQSVGFQIVETYEVGGETWYVVVWDWRSL